LKYHVFCLTLALVATSSALTAQFPSTPSYVAAAENNLPPSPAPKATFRAVNPSRSSLAPTPFSRIAVGGGLGIMGANMQLAVYANRYMNLRGTGNYFDYSVNNVNVSGFNLNGKLNFATGGASVDFYPFPRHGLRISPGALFYNQNNVNANLTVAGGTKLTLNSIDYYASASSPIVGNGSIGLNSRNPAFSITTGWGNMISRKGGHWSAPFEIGAAMTGAPTVSVALTSGQACDAQGQNCVDVATDPTVQSNLQAQITKYRNDLNSFGFYPIINFGIGYSFGLR